MKKLFVFISILFSVNAWAADFSDQKMMEVLVANSGDVRVYTKQDNGEKFHKMLSVILAEQMLMNNHLSAHNGTSVILTNNSISCDEGDAALGSFYKGCTLVLSNGDYLKKNLKYLGPELESAIIIDFTIRYSNVSGTYKVYQDKALAFFAG